MSMTREEAIKHLLHDWHINLGCDFAIKPGRLDDFLGALDVALSALRPITREQVEKAWRGEWKGVPKLGVYDMACSKCGYSTGIRFYSSEFCPNCGVPMTDEAVETIMKRMEEMRND